MTDHIKRATLDGGVLSQGDNSPDASSVALLAFFARVGWHNRPTYVRNCRVPRTFLSISLFHKGGKQGA